MSAFAPTISLPNIETAFDSKGTAMVPVTTGRGNKKLGKIEIKSPMEQVTNFFAGIDKSLVKLVDFAKKSLGLAEKEQKRLDEKFIGPMPSTAMIRTGRKALVGTDDKEEDGEKKESPLKALLKQFKESFDNVSFGEKMTAALLTGGLALFLNYREAIEKALYPFVALIKGVVDIIGVKGTLFSLFGILLTVKLLPVIKAAKDVVAYLGGFLPSFKTLKAAFVSMRLFLGTTLPLKLKNAYRGTDNFLVKAFTKLGNAFKIMRVFLLKTLVPSIMSMVTTLGAAIAPILIPIAVIAAIAAGIAAVLFSIKSGFETFKNSLAEGDSMLLAIGKGIADFALTLYTLPLTLIKKLVGYIAGLFGFDGIKEALDKFSFKDFIKNSFMGFVKGFVRLIKAIAKGAAAALAAIAPGGKTPQGEFSRVYNEVMSGGQGQIKIEKTDLEKTGTDGEPELTENKIAKKVKLDEKGNVIKDDVIPGFFGMQFSQPVIRMKSLDEKRLDKELKLLEEIKLHNKEAASKLNTSAMYQEISDKSTNVINNINEAPIEVNNTEAFQRFINSQGGRYGNSF